MRSQWTAKERWHKIVFNLNRHLLPTEFGTASFGAKLGSEPSPQVSRQPYLDLSLFHLLYNVLETFFNRFERGSWIGFQAKAQVICTKHEHIHAWLGKFSCVDDCIDRFQLQAEDAIAVPPLGVLQAVISVLNPTLNWVPNSSYREVDSRRH